MASLGTHVKLNGFLGQHFDAEIFSASIGIRAQRCAVSDVEPEDTHFRLLGFDLKPTELLGLPVINTGDPDNAVVYKESKDCEAALEAYENAADRAKKAFRDAPTARGAVQRREGRQELPRR